MKSKMYLLFYSLTTLLLEDKENCSPSDSTSTGLTSNMDVSTVLYRHFWLFQHHRSSTLNHRMKKMLQRFGFRNHPNHNKLRIKKIFNGFVRSSNRNLDRKLLFPLAKFIVLFGLLIRWDVKHYYKSKISTSKWKFWNTKNFFTKKQ